MPAPPQHLCLQWPTPFPSCHTAVATHSPGAPHPSSVQNHSRSWRCSHVPHEWQEKSSLPMTRCAVVPSPVRSAHSSQACSPRATPTLATLTRSAHFCASACPQKCAVRERGLVRYHRKWCGNTRILAPTPLIIRMRPPLFAHNCTITRQKYARFMTHQPHAPHLLPTVPRTSAPPTLIRASHAPAGHAPPTISETLRPRTAPWKLPRPPPKIPPARAISDQKSPCFHRCSMRKRCGNAPILAQTYLHF